MPVYIVQCTGTDRVKIGFSAQPYLRLKKLSTSSPYPLRLVKSVAGDYKTEREFHRHFAEYRRHGEWFEFTDEMLYFMDRRLANSGEVFQSNGYILDQNGIPWPDMSAYGISLRYGYGPDIDRDEEGRKYLIAKNVPGKFGVLMRELGFSSMLNEFGVWISETTEIDFVAISKAFPEVLIVKIAISSVTDQFGEQGNPVSHDLKYLPDLTAYGLELTIREDERGLDVAGRVDDYIEGLEWLGFRRDPTRDGLMTLEMDVYECRYWSMDREKWKQVFLSLPIDIRS